MNINEVKEDLQALINRLQDSEKGYEEIEKASGDLDMKALCRLMAKERHRMHTAIENHMKDYNLEPEVDTSFTGAVHRAWIDIKISSWGDNFVSIVNEIERGSQALIDLYQETLDNNEFTITLKRLLIEQQETINLELNRLRGLRDSAE